jgi:hypothetical protein
VHQAEGLADAVGVRANFYGNYGIRRRNSVRFRERGAAKQPANIVDLNLVHSLLVAAEEQPYGFLRVRHPDLVREVELMAAAGLVHASIGNDNSESFAVISRVTESGQVFLRAFREQPPPKIERKEAFAFADLD